MQKLILLAVGSVLAWGIFKRAKVQYDKAQGWDWRLNNFFFLGYSAGRARFQVDLELINKADVPLTIGKIDLRAYSGGTYLGLMSKPEFYTLPANGSSNFAFTVEIDISSIKGGVQEVLYAIMNTEDVPLSFRGAMVIKQGAILIPTPVIYNTTIKEIFA
jgi:hypothetical protein